MKMLQQAIINILKQTKKVLSKKKKTEHIKKIQEKTLDQKLQ